MNKSAGTAIVALPIFGAGIGWLFGRTHWLASRPVSVVGPAQSTGRKIRFVPDHAIFSGLAIDADVLEKRLRELADRNTRFKIRFADERGPGARLGEVWNGEWTSRGRKARSSGMRRDRAGQKQQFCKFEAVLVFFIRFCGTSR
jgi:hypothetical protein